MEKERTDKDRAKLAGMYVNSHDGKMYRVTIQRAGKRKLNLIYFMECVNSELKKGINEIKPEFLEKLISYGHFKKVIN